MDDQDILSQLEEDLQEFGASTKDMSSISEVAKKLINLDQTITSKESELDDLTKQRRKIAEEILPDAMAQFGIDQIKLDNGAKITISPNIYAHISKENQSRAYDWLRDNGVGAIIKNEVAVQFDKTQDAEAVALKNKLSNEGFGVLHTEKIHHSTLKATCKELVEKGVDIPQDIINIHIGKKAKISNS